MTDFLPDTPAVARPYCPDCEPDADPLSVEDYAATIFHQIGIEHHKYLITPGGRPQFIVKDFNAAGNEARLVKYLATDAGARALKGPAAS